MVVKFTFQSVFGNSLQIQDTSAREVARSHSSCILSFDLIGLHQNKRFTSRKSFCRSGSQTLFFGEREATTGNASALRRLFGVALLSIKCDRILCFRKSAAVLIFAPLILRVAFCQVYTVWIAFAVNLCYI